MTLPQIMLCDPDYFWYMVEIDAFRNWDRRLGKEAADIAEKARRIKIPKIDGLKPRSSGQVSSSTICGWSR
jgi:hypothetical protein